MAEIPCKNCICWAICINRLDSNDLNYIKSFMSCGILDKFVGGIYQRYKKENPTETVNNYLTAWNDTKDLLNKMKEGNDEQ